MNKLLNRYGKLILIILSVVVLPYASYAAAYNYEIRKTDNHVIHILNLSPVEYEIRFVKAHDRVLGRETVVSMAERQNADIAINGGFFEIGGIKDGMPSGSLIIDGKIFGLRSKEHACIIKNSFEKLFIQKCGFDVAVKMDNKIININKVNQFPANEEAVLFTDAWGPNTLTNFKSRKEIAFDNNGTLGIFHEHGNIPVPKGGFVLSLPASYKLDKALLNFPIVLNFGNALLNKNEKFSAVMGIPQIILNGKVTDEVLKYKSSFYSLPHARTAIGIKNDGEIIIVVAEHAYKKNLKKITLEEVKSVIQNNKSKLVEQYKKEPNDITLKELKEVIEKEYLGENKALGLTILELANLMVELGCNSAINLDGGGSSVLWVEGKVINQPIGDEDEGESIVTLRPVSDSIIFKKKNVVETVNPHN